MCVYDVRGWRAVSLRLAKSTTPCSNHATVCGHDARDERGGRKGAERSLHRDAAIDGTARFL